MHILQIKVDVSPRKKIEFVQVVTQMLGVRSHSEIMRCSISEDVCVPNVYIYMEEWEARDLMQQHLDHEDFRALLGAMKALGIIKEAKIITSGEIEDYKLD